MGAESLSQSEDVDGGINEDRPSCPAPHAEKAQYQPIQEPTSNATATNSKDHVNRCQDHVSMKEASSQPPHTILSEKTKVATIITASLYGFISPVSAAIYFPAINTIAKDLSVSVSLINLTRTAYMIFQGIAPTFIGSLSNEHGRRPAYAICFVLYIGANIGLALQTNFAALLVLRCLQASGSSGTIALSSGIVADLATGAERGKYIGYASLGQTLGPALGPIIGGLLGQFLGWRALFWFLSIFAGAMLLVLLAFFPETSRAVVGNGSVPPQSWNVPLVALLTRRHRHQSNAIAIDRSTISRPRQRPSPLASLRILFEKEAGSVLLVGALQYAGFFAIVASLSPMLATSYGFNDLQIGACYVPYGLGSLTARWTVGRLLDRNFALHARRANIQIVKNRQQDLHGFQIEKARLQVGLPLLYAACATVLCYSWVLAFRVSIVGPVICLFFVGHLVSGSFNVMNTLVVDLNRDSPASAVAANNLCRCLLGAGAVAASVPLIDKIGVGWMGTLVVGIWVIASSSLWAVLWWGEGWRAERREKMLRRMEKKGREEEA